MTTPVLEFRTPIPVETPLGRGYALFVEIDNHVQYWTVVLDNCAFMTYPQDKIKACRSYTHGRGITDDQMQEILDEAFHGRLERGRSSQE